MTGENTAESNGPVKSFAETFTPRLVEALRSNYTLADLKADASAGFSVAMVSLPLAMALAVASGVSPASGLAAAVVGGFFTSLLGGSRYQIGGPATAFVALMATTVESHGFDGLLVATIMAGLILLALGYMRFGTYIKYLPHSVPVGFTAGVAVILLTSQARDFLGLQISHVPAGFLPKLEAISANLGAIHYQSFAARLGDPRLHHLSAQAQASVCGDDDDYRRLFRSRLAFETFRSTPSARAMARFLTWC